jgi:N-acetylglucosamine-6-sulfatase
MVAFAGGLLLAGCAHAPTRLRSPETARKPNIVVIMNDDLDARSAELLPHVRKLLAKEGVAFSRYFASTPICAPSRASLLTGQYAHNHRVWTNTPPEGGFERFRDRGREASTVATWLQAAGYRTMLAGKYMNGYPAQDATYVPPGWNEWFGSFTREKYFGYRLNENGTLKPYGKAPEDYETDVLAGKAVDFIRRSVADGQPFFAYVTPSAPHFRPIAAQRHAGAFAESKAPRTPSFNEDDVSTKPAWVQTQSALTPEHERRIDELWRQRMQTLLAVDELVRSIVDALKASGQLGNTYVFFTSDNGFHLGEHRVDKGKGTPYEESIRVPLFVRGPGVPRGKTLSHLVTNVDLAPTFAELGRAQGPPQLDGRSLVGLLSRTPADLGQWRQELLVEYWAADEEGIPNWTALRTDKLTYVEYATGERELYELADDPFELDNLNEATPAPDLAALNERLARLRGCHGTACSGEAPSTSSGAEHATPAATP